ncbi:uncharacterized protein T551_00755 [Pneumocystis jirovecii RU7]|uniref:Ketopantoate reductase C-terminal domain-containing protein n=1 Tax=Pneumocystis jirovecii (strain RU7) TaxID=1408657 RepID=A0A0W4ZUL1_PNEJ7|nr:uncharacterized protein T551_00755 [Pneumocystis jirovecii RU7]KTW32073.1 hypothetical protein T551_00755 [Pneumocystis jirovecii RU7]
MEPLESVVQPTSTDIFKPSEIVTNRTSSPSSSLVHILSGKFEMDIVNINILSIVGSNSISAFFSWRLQSSNACKVTLVWRNHFDAVSSYGISFKSNTYGSERFRPHRIVQTIEEAKDPHYPFDYIFVCIKALPDLYDIATIIESVVTPSHTCIIINTSNAIGIEGQLIERFPKNLVLSLVSEATFTQLNVADYEHSGPTNVWIGLVQPNSVLPEEIQRDMIESLTLTLKAGNVECHFSSNILQQQWEKMIGPIAFHPISVLFDEPNHSVLLEKQNAKKIISGLLDELLRIARAQNCNFDIDFKSKIMNTMAVDTSQSIMFQDYTARRPMEIHVFLANPLDIANKHNIDVPRLEIIHALMHNLNNCKNIHKPSPSASIAFSRQLSPRPTVSKEHHKHHLVHEPNGYNVPSGDRHNYKRRSPQPLIRRDSLEGLQEFADIAMYGDMIHVSNTDDNETHDYKNYVCNNNNNSYNYAPRQRRGTLSHDSMSIKEKELALYRRERMLYGKEMLEHKKKATRYPRNHISDEYSTTSYGYDDDDYGDFPVSNGPPNVPPPINSDNFDMMSMTFRRHRKNTTKISANSIRNTFNNRSDINNDYMTWGGRQRSRSRSQQYSLLDSSLLDTCDYMQSNLMLGYSSNRYGTVDSKALVNSRANSLTTTGSNEMRDSNMYSTYHNHRSTIQHASVNDVIPAHNSHHVNHPYPSTMTSGGVPRSAHQRVPSASLTSLQHMPPRNIGIHPQLSHGSSKNSSNVNPHRSLTGSASASITSNGNRCASGSGSGHSSISSFERGGMI